MINTLYNSMVFVGENYICLLNLSGQYYCLQSSNLRIYNLQKLLLACNISSPLYCLESKTQRIEQLHEPTLAPFYYLVDYTSEHLQTQTAVSESPSPVDSTPLF